MWTCQSCFQPAESSHWRQGREAPNLEAKNQTLGLRTPLLFCTIKHHVSFQILFVSSILLQLFLALAPVAFYCELKFADMESDVHFWIISTKREILCWLRVFGYHRMLTKPFYCYYIVTGTLYELPISVVKWYFNFIYILLHSSLQWRSTLQRFMIGWYSLGHNYRSLGNHSLRLWVRSRSRQYITDYSSVSDSRLRPNPTPGSTLAPQPHGKDCSVPLVKLLGRGASPRCA